MWKNQEPDGYPPPYWEEAKPLQEAPQLPQPSAPPQHPSSVTVTLPVKVPGSCPICANTNWTGTYSCFAWFLCLFCFWNCGLCCCLCMRKKKCTKCGFTVN